MYVSNFIMFTSVLLTTYYVASVCGQESYRAHDFMGYTDKKKMLSLALVLLKDAKLKVRQVREIRDEHSVFLAFDVGDIIGRMREKYKRMMEVYREAGDRLNGRVTLQGPGLRDFKPYVYIVSMEIVHIQEVDIDKLVDILEHIPKELLSDRASPLLEEDTTTTKKPLRSDNSLAMRIREEEYKSKLRQQYAIKKLGINKTGWAWDISSA